VCVNKELDLARIYVAEIKCCVTEKACGMQREMNTACKILVMKRQLMDPNMHWRILLRHILEKWDKTIL